MAYEKPVKFFFLAWRKPGFQACVFEFQIQDCTPCMESDVTQSALFYKLWAWGEVHKKQLLIGLIGVIVAGVVIAFWLAHQSQQQNEANDALSKLVVRNLPGPEATPESLLKVAGTYPDTEAAQRAALLAATDLYADGNYDEARAQFQRFMQDHADSPFTPEASLGLASCMDAQGRMEDAINAYRNVAERYPTSGVVPQAKLALARLYLAQGKLEDASSALQEVLHTTPGQMSAEARMQLEELVTAHPELFPSSRPPSPPPVAVPANQPTTSAPIKLLIPPTNKP
jgi:FimV-like protein